MQVCDSSSARTAVRSSAGEIPISRTPFDPLTTTKPSKQYEYLVGLRPQIPDDLKSKPTKLTRFSWEPRFIDLAVRELTNHIAPVERNKAGPFRSQMALAPESGPGMRTLFAGLDVGSFALVDIYTVFWRGKWMSDVDYLVYCLGTYVRY